jgi:hypothetical protein
MVLSQINVKARVLSKLKLTERVKQRQPGWQQLQASGSLGRGRQPSQSSSRAGQSKPPRLFGKQKHATGIEKEI